MKIFVLLSRIPWPLEKGDKLRAFNQIKQLSKRHEIVLCALNTDRKADKQAAFKALQPYCVSVTFIDLSLSGILINLLKAWLNGKPLQSGYFYARNAANKIDKLLQHHKPDMIYGQLIRVAEYIRHKNIPKALDYQDVFSMGMKRRMQVASWLAKPFFLAEYLRLQRYEASIFDDFDIKTIISEPDRFLIPHPKRDAILIVPNGVDQDFFAPRATEKKYELVFTGNMAYPPNVNAVEFLANDIMPKVWKLKPHAKLLIAGATPDAKVKAAASKNIIVSGWMDDIREAYASSKVFIAPMRIGTGLQNKLLEAMSMQLPCITTSLAKKALFAVENQEILVADDASGLAKNIISLLDDTAFADQLAANGHLLVNRHYDWEAATFKLENAMLQLLANKEN